MSERGPSPERIAAQTIRETLGEVTPLIANLGVRLPERARLIGKVTDASIALDELLAALIAERQRADEYGRALARIGELNPEFATGGKGAWQVRAEIAEAERDDARRQLARYVEAHDGPTGAYARAESLARQLAQAREALLRLSDYNEGEPCWCPAEWWERRDESGVHSKTCDFARAALAELPETPPQDEAPKDTAHAGDTVQSGVPRGVRAQTSSLPEPPPNQTVAAYGRPSEAAEAGRRAVDEHAGALRRLADHDAGVPSPGEQRP